MQTCLAISVNTNEAPLSLDIRAIPNYHRQKAEYHQASATTNGHLLVHQSPWPQTPARSVYPEM